MYFQINLFSLGIKGKQNMEFPSYKKLQFSSVQFTCYPALPESSKTHLLHTQNVLWDRISNLVYSETMKCPYQNVTFVDVKNV